MFRNQTTAKFDRGLAPRTKRAEDSEYEQAEVSQTQSSQKDRRILEAQFHKVCGVPSSGLGTAAPIPMDFSRPCF